MIKKEQVAIDENNEEDSVEEVIEIPPFIRGYSKQELETLLNILY